MVTGLYLTLALSLSISLCPIHSPAFLRIMFLLRGSDAELGEAIHCQCLASPPHSQPQPQQHWGDSEPWGKVCPPLHYLWHSVRLYKWLDYCYCCGDYYCVCLLHIRLHQHIWVAFSATHTYIFACKANTHANKTRLVSSTSSGRQTLYKSPLQLDHISKQFYEQQHNPVFLLFDIVIIMHLLPHLTIVGKYSLSKLDKLCQIFT